MSESLSSYRRSTLARMPSHVASLFFFLPPPAPASPWRRQSRTDAGRSPHGRVEVELELPRERREHDLAQVSRWLAPGEHDSFEDRDARVAEHELLADAASRAEPTAGGARAEGRVEGEVARFELGHGDAAHRQPYFSEKVSTVPGVGVEHLDQPLGELERRLDGVGETAAIVGAHDERSTTTEIE
jgi:hypothetical protein